MFFLADIAFMWELFGFCIGLAFLGRARTEGGLARAAGVILIIGSLALALCTAMGVNKRKGWFDKEHMKRAMHEQTEEGR
jgi:hypothetical protein